ncbi:uncharacterized protein VTP21DRAFT_10792 [Calcarisporiella thermophila]|uniref:uncharacterized protein n=1 Tax=Calcarisporiella thermophila TaxID=911321 RepID=UPI0037434F92
MATPTTIRTLPCQNSTPVSFSLSPISGNKSSYSPLSPKQTAPLLKLLRSAKKRRSPLNKGINKKSSAQLGGPPPQFDVVGKDWLGLGNSPKKGKKIKAHYDRYIPNRTAMDMPSSQLNIGRREAKPDYLDSATIAYQEQVAKACGIALDKRILAFNAEPPSNDKEDLRTMYNRPLKKDATGAQFRRRILTAPERVLDAPGLVDDYYLNLLDWSCLNVLAVGLDRSVYLWNADSGDVNCLCTVAEEDQIASLTWSPDGNFLSIGTFEGDVQIWDAESAAKIRTMTGHQARVGVLSWDKSLLSSGCRDGSIWHHDVRVAQHKVAELLAHTSEVCGLKWRSDGQQLASGGNDNLVNIWDARSSVPRFTKANHTAAVKAVAWCPWQTNLLATGGGSYDRHIHFWNTTTAARVNSVDTGSQVTSIIWSQEYKELLTSHGFPDHHLAVWSYPSLNKVIDIPAHETRVLHTAISPDGQTVATGASDENLKFWKIFESKPQAKSVKPKESAESGSTSMRMSIR